MQYRTTVAAVLVFALSMEMPVTARAQESQPASSEVMTMVVPVLPPIGARLSLMGATPTQSSLRLFAPRPQDVRLSSGAKTAIIITAIIVGALLIVGAVAIGRPGHHL